MEDQLSSTGIKYYDRYYAYAFKLVDENAPNEQRYARAIEALKICNEMFPKDIWYERWVYCEYSGMMGFVDRDEAMMFRLSCP